MTKAKRKPLRFLSPIHKASRQISVYMERQMAGTGLTTTEGHLLTYLRVYGPCAITVVASVFDMRGSTMTSVLDRLESRGVVSRTLNPADRRSFLLALTPEGERLADDVQQFVDKLERDIARNVSAEEEDGFRAIMTAIENVTAKE